MSLDRVVDLLPEYACLGVMCRMMRVSKTLHACIAENLTMFNVYTARMGLSNSKKNDIGLLLHKMKHTKRCTGCGQRCTRKPRVCRDCLRDPLNYFGMVTRQQIAHILYHDTAFNKGWRMSTRSVISKLAPVSRTVPYGTFLYWTHEVRQFTTSPITSQSLEA